MRLVTALAVALTAAAVAARSSEGDVRGVTHDNNIKFVKYPTKSSTTICVGDSLADATKFNLIETLNQNEKSHEGTVNSEDVKCADFATATMPANGVRVTYLFVHSKGDETGSVISEVSFEFQAESTIANFKCGKLDIQMTHGGADCIGHDAPVGPGTKCYKDVTTPVPPRGEAGVDRREKCKPVTGDHGEFQCCQPAGEEIFLTLDEGGSISSLEYEAGTNAKIKLAFGQNLKAADVVDVLYISSQVKDVLDLKDESNVQLDNFERGIDTHTVCPVGDEYYSDDSITDINIAATVDEESVSGESYYEFGFTYVEGSPETYQAQSEPNNMKVDCSNLQPSDDTRCYGYVEKGLHPLQISHDSGTNIIIFAPKN